MDDLAWKRDKMRRQTQEAAKAVASLYGGPTTPPELAAPAAKDTVTPLGATQPYQLSMADKTAPEHPFNDAMSAGLGEYVHGVGDVGDAVSAPMLYAGRKVGKGIYGGLGGTMPTQEASDEAGAVSDVAAPFKRILARGSGDLSDAPNQRKGLTSTVIGEAIESGRLAADPNASAGERGLGVAGALAGGLSVVAAGGVPARVNPGKAVSSYVDELNTRRILSGQRPIPNPSLAGLLTPPKDIGDPSKLHSIFFHGAAGTPDEYIQRATASIRQKFAHLAKSGEIHQFDEKIGKQIMDAGNSTIADALRDPASNPELSKAIRKVYDITKKETADDLKGLGAEKVINKGDTAAPAPESRPSIEEVQARLKAQYGVEPNKISNKTDPNEYAEAARDLGIDPAELRRADKQIIDEMDNSTVGEEVTKGVLAGNTEAKTRSLAEEAVELRNTLHPDSEQEIAALASRLKASSPDEVESVADAFNLRIKSKSDGIKQIVNALDQQLGSIHRSLTIESGAGAGTNDYALISKLAEEKKAEALAKRSKATLSETPATHTTPVSKARSPVMDRLLPAGKEPQVAPVETPPPAPDVVVRPLRPSSFKADASAGNITSDTAATNGMLGPSRYFSARRPQKPGAFSGTTAQQAAPRDPFAPSGNPAFQADATGSNTLHSDMAAIERPPATGVGQTEITQAERIGEVVPPGHPPPAPPDSRTQPTPWTQNPDILNKAFSVGRGTMVLNSDNQIERLLAHGRDAMKAAKKNPLRQVDPESLKALEEADARTKTVIKDSDKWYSEIGQAASEAERQLVGKNIGGWRSRELLDLKSEVPHPANPNALFTKMSAILDDAARPAFAQLQPMNQLQSNYLDTVKVGMQYTGQKAAEAGVVMRDAAGNARFFEGGADAARMLRNYNPDTLHRMATDTKFADEVFDVVLALPENAGIDRADAHKMMQGLKARIDKGEAFEIERQIPLWPDRVVTQSFGEVPLNDFIHHVLPTRGYSGGGIGAVLKNQLRRAAVVREFGTLGADGTKFRNLIEGPAGLDTKIGRLGAGASDEFKSLIAAVSGNRAQAGYFTMANNMPPNALGKGLKAFTQYAADLATSMAGLKSVGQPFEVAAEMPGGFLARSGELVKVMADQARGLTGQVSSRLGMRGLGNKLAGGDHRLEMAKVGLPVEDMATATLSFIPRFQGEINNLGKVESTIKGAGDIFTAPGRILADIVAGTNDMVSARSGVRQAEAYVKLAAKGNLKQSDLARLTNNSMSNESIAWLKGLKGKNIEDLPAAEVSEFARELGSNIAQRLQRRLANPAFNQKFINDPLIRDHVKFMNYQFTAWRATEDTAKNVKAIWRSNASPADKAKSIGDIMGGFGTRLLGTAAGGGIALMITNALLDRKQSDLAKQGLLGKMIANIGAANIFGTAGIAGDMALGAAGVPRKYASRGGKEDRPGAVDDLVFTGRAMDSAKNIVMALVGYPVAKVMQGAGMKLKKPPEKMLTDAAKSATGTLNKALIKQAGGPDLTAKRPAASGGSGPSNLVPFRAKASGAMGQKPLVPFRKSPAKQGGTLVPFRK